MTKNESNEEEVKPKKLMKILFTPDEQACVKLAANLKGQHANEYMRRIVVAQAKKDLKAMNNKITKMADSIQIPEFRS